MRFIDDMKNSILLPKDLPVLGKRKIAENSTTRTERCTSGVI
jgi:hypothetical protein